MNKVKITVLKRTFHEGLAEEYAVEGFGKCPGFREATCFILILGSRRTSVTRTGRLSINTYLHLHTAVTKYIFDDFHKFDGIWTMCIF